MAIVYLTLDQILEARRLALEASESQNTGGANLGTIESILEHIQNDIYYPTFEEKLTHLFFGLAKFHCFADGNKRTALAATLYMLRVNGAHDCANSFLRDNENVVVHVAANKIDKRLLHRIIAAKLADEFDDDEALKLELLLAIS